MPGIPHFCKGLLLGDKPGTAKDPTNQPLDDRLPISLSTGAGFVPSTMGSIFIQMKLDTINLLIC